ncbi:4-hydroxy-3-methylbut-2-enyl diphosphate reductase [Puteibacter caeruleilacunae]|nr:4-hydroxy-3-methylbut-2-enyl diphosphate reductase [Puteibacter caeruleilacunae]
MMQIEIDSNSGFCFGVINAIKMAEEALDTNNKLYCLGDIVHNNMEVDRLNKLGLITITHAEYFRLENCKVLIRAHGEPPSTYEYARKANIELIDATCPVVLRLQKRVKTGYEALSSDEGQVVIYGRKGHAEVNGLNGQIEDKAIILEGPEDLSQVDFNRPILLFSQTTKPIDGFTEIVEEIQQKAKSDVKVHDTICRQVSNRVPKIQEFAAKFDLIIFVSGKKSSNGKSLFKMCQQANANSHFISNPEELDEKWFENIESVGICGATSTPLWLMTKVADTIKELVAE